MCKAFIQDHFSVGCWSVLGILGSPHQTIPNELWIGRYAVFYVKLTGEQKWHEVFAVFCKKNISNRLLVFAKFQSKSMLQVSLVCSTFTFHAIAIMLPKTFRTFSICMCAKTKTILYYLYYYEKTCNKSTWEKV